MKKQCSKCGEIKDISEFGIQRDKKDGHKYQCKLCSKETNRKSYLKNIEARVKGDALYRKNNKEKEQLRRKKYYDNNKDRSREYVIANKEIIAERMKVYRENNKEKINERKKERYNTDISYKLRCRLASSSVTALKGSLKTAKTKELLGCTIGELREHFKSMFYDRSTGETMTWDNYGLYGWHIDHRLPCASFDLTDPEQQKKCFHYTNLQPLWAEDNLSKSDKLDWVKEA